MVDALSDVIVPGGPFPLLGEADVTIILNEDIILTSAQAALHSLNFLSDGNSNGIRNAFAPLVKGRFWLVNNNTSEGFAINFTGVTGTGVSIPPGQSAIVQCYDGANMRSVSSALPNPLTVPATSGTLASGSNTPVAWQVVSATTSNNTPTVLATFAVPPSSTVDTGLTIVGRSVAGDFYRADLFSTANRIAAGETALTPPTPTPQNPQPSGSSCTVTLTVSGDNLVVTVTGLSGVVMDWSVMPQYQQVQSSTFSPANLPGLKAWLRSDVVTQSGGNVTAWPDQSANANNALVTHGTPTYVASGGANNLPYIRTLFGGYEVMQIPITVGQPFEVFIVARSTNEGGGGVYLFDTGANDNAISQLFNTTQLAMYSGTAVLGPSTTLNEDFFCDAAFEGSSSQISINGGELTLGNPGSGAGPTGVLTIGGYGLVSSTGWGGYFYEIILVVGRILTSLERSELNTYAALRYGIG